jgi:hypothetical protein
MNIARPATGFRLSEPATFATYLINSEQQWPRARDHWEAVKDRLKMTAHREGVAVGNPANRVFESVGDSTSGFPTIRVAYFVLGDSLTFIAISVFAP